MNSFEKKTKQKTKQKKNKKNTYLYLFSNKCL